MNMLVTYQFKAQVDVLDRGHYGLEPRCHTEEREVDYDYWADVDEGVVIAYLGVQRDFQTEAMAKEILEKFGSDIEDDEDFQEFVKGWFEEAAYDEFSQYHYGN